MFRHAKVKLGRAIERSASGSFRAFGQLEKATMTQSSGCDAVIDGTALRRFLLSS
jgi:hypothetical protein